MPTMHQPVQDRYWRAERILLSVALLIGIGSALRLFLGGGSLWQDEIIAVTHTLEPLPYFFVEVLRHDIHPFFYFLVLKAWGALFPDTDQWLLASSLAGAAFSLAVIAVVTYRLYGTRAMYWAVALYALLPAFAWSASTLRMYALLPGLVVLAWYAGLRFLNTGDRRWMLAMVVVELMIIYSHAIGFFFAGLVAIAALVEQYRTAPAGAVRHWWISQVLVGLLALPVLASALVRGTEKLPSPDLFYIMTMPGRIIAGWRLEWNHLALAAGSAVFLVLLLLALRQPRARIATIVIVIGAMVLAVLVSLAGKSLLKVPVFAASLTPFLAISAAAGIAANTDKLARYLAWLLAVPLAIATPTWAKHLEQPSGYRPVAEQLMSRVTEGDLVVADNLSAFWGTARYAVGPRWGTPLDVAPLQDNDNWRRLKQKAGPALVEALHLTPKRDFVDHDGVRYVIGNDIAHHMDGRRTIWALFDLRTAKTIHTGKPLTVTGIDWIRGMALVRAEYDPGGAPYLEPPPRRAKQ